MPEEKEIKKASKRGGLGKWIRRILLIPVVLVALLLLALGALYVPGVLNLVASKVLPGVEKSSGMRIQVENIDLDFPLTLKVDGVTIITVATTDTMLTASHVEASAELWPLFEGRIGVRRAEALKAMYSMGGADSLYIRAQADSLSVAAAMMTLGFDRIEVGSARLAGADVKLLMGPGGSEKTDTTPSKTSMLIEVGRVELARVDYRMSMTSGIAPDSLLTDTIAANIGFAELERGVVDITPGQIDITCRSLTLDAPSGLYGRADAVPEPGFDMNWISVSETSMSVQDFEMRGSALTVPLMSLHTRERCGLTLEANGVFAMDSDAMRATDFHIKVGESLVNLDAEMGLDSVPERAPLKASLAAEIGVADIMAALPALTPVLSPMPSQVPLRLRADVSGTMQHVDVDTLSASMQRVFAVAVSGEASGFTDPTSMVANLSLRGSLVDPGPVQKMVKGVRIPPLTLSGSAKANRGKYAADITARTSSGRLALKGTYAGTAPDYSADLVADSLPIGAFMPNLGVGAVTAHVKAKGSGFNVWSRRTSADASVDIDRVEYNRAILRDVSLDASLCNGAYTAELTSGTPAAMLNLAANGTLAPNELTWTLNGDVKELNLQALGLTDSLMHGSLGLSSEGRLDPGGDSISVVARVTGLDWIQGQAHLMADTINVGLHGTPVQVAASVRNRSLNVEMDADTSLYALLDAVSRVGAEASAQFAARSVYADTLHMLLPPLRLNVSAGADNLINDYLQPSQISFRNLELHAANDSSLHAKLDVLSFRSGSSLRIDTITASLSQRDSALLLAADMGNRPGTFDEFARVGMRGGIEGDLARFYIKQQNIRGETGYSLGFEVRLADSLITVNFTPLNPVIAYKDWTFNEGNFVSVNPYTFHIDADLDASGAGSRLQLFTRHAHESADADSITSANDALTLKVTDVHIQDWLSINPFAPPIAGDVSADMNFTYNDTSVNGRGDVNLLNLTYGKQRVGDFDLALDLGTNRDGVVNADVALMVDSVKTITAVGALNDSTKASPFMLDFSMIHFPLRVVNPFLPSGVAQLSGDLNGKMDITGTLAKPCFDGYLDFDSAAVNVGMIGTGFTFSEEKIPVDSNVVSFQNFAITGANKNALLINGTVDMTSLSDPSMALSLNARDMMVVNSKKRKGVDVYGKAYVDLDASVRGNLRFMSVDASLTLLPQTDVTYIYSSAESQIGLQNTSDMVRFVNLRDTTAVIEADSVVQTSMQMMLNARLDVRQGSTISVDLSADGKNKAQIKGDGILNYTQTPMAADGRLTGRFTINEGFVRYSLPVISEKNFSFTPGSYVTWTGSMLNPTLSVSAVDEVRANVTQEGANSRLVNFDVTLSATGTLEHMNVAFDLSTNDDISVQNELKSMSAQQRANQAMNLLLYNTYTGPNTTGNANLSGNPLYSFLTSQLNTWAANTIKGVDVSFGLDQYNSTRDGSTSTATQYSYKVSKSLFNNRFKIVVGGNYSTDASEDENLTQNLISDISFEYMLNDAGSMYVRLFRHTGYESILEGEITQTGVGFVLKRKIQRIGDIFRFRRRTSVAAPQPITSTSNAANNENEPTDE